MFITDKRSDPRVRLQEQRFSIEQLEKGDLEYGKWWWYIFAIPVMKLMELWVACKRKLGKLLGFEPRRTAIPFDRDNSWTHDLIEHATEWISLDKQYPLANKSFRAFRRDKKTKDSLDALWMKYMLHNQAVRNRFRIVKSLLKKNIKKLAAAGKQQIRIVGLASGSGRDIIEVVSELRGNTDMPRLKVFLIDHNRDAVDKSEELASEYNLSDQFECIRGMIKSGPPPGLVTKRDYPASERLGSALKELRTDICYNIGFFDYKSDDVVVRMKKSICQGLRHQGVLISGNIIPNPEMGFLPSVINWAKMYHRTPKEFAELMVDAGFSDIDVFVEPNEIFSIGVGKVNTPP